MNRVLLIALWLVAAANATAATFDDAERQARYRGLITELRCVICQNESIATSGAPLAQDMRGLVAEQIRAGRSDEQIKQYLVDRYGSWVLYDPPFSPATWLLWLGPGVLLVLGLATALVVLRRRQQTTAAPALDRERLARVLDETSKPNKADEQHP